MAVIQTVNLPNHFTMIRINSATFLRINYVYYTEAKILTYDIKIAVTGNIPDLFIRLPK
jgi:hypothetical protein